eukprot:scaffold397573_cov43-Prasinocladus_malaysianus.AAC.1
MALRSRSLRLYSRSRRAVRYLLQLSGSLGRSKQQGALVSVSPTSSSSLGVAGDDACSDPP